MELQAKDDALMAFDDDFDNLRDDQDMLLNDIEDQDLPGEEQIQINNLDELEDQEEYGDEEDEEELERHR
jgi:hypothetical protein